MEPKLVCANFSFLTCYDQFIMHIFGQSNCIIVTAAYNLCLLHEERTKYSWVHCLCFPCISIPLYFVSYRCNTNITSILGKSIQGIQSYIVLDKVVSVKSSYISIRAHIDPVRQSGKELGFISQLSYIFVLNPWVVAVLLFSILLVGTCPAAWLHPWLTTWHYKLAWNLLPCTHKHPQPAKLFKSQRHF